MIWVAVQSRLLEKKLRARLAGKTGKKWDPIFQFSAGNSKLPKIKVIDSTSRNRARKIISNEVARAKIRQTKKHLETRFHLYGIAEESTYIIGP